MGASTGAPQAVGPNCGDLSDPGSSVDWHFQVRGVPAGASPSKLEGSMGGAWVVPTPSCDGHWPMLASPQEEPDGTYTWDLWIEPWPGSTPAVGAIYTVTLGPDEPGLSASTTIEPNSAQTLLLFSGTGNYEVGPACGHEEVHGSTRDWNFRLIGVPEGYEPVQLDDLSSGARWVSTCNTQGNWPLKLENKGDGVWYLYVEAYPGERPAPGSNFEVTLHPLSGGEPLSIRAANNIACGKLGAQTLDANDSEFISYSRSCPVVAKWVEAGDFNFDALRNFKQACPFSLTLLRKFREETDADPDMTGGQLWQELFGSLDGATEAQKAFIDYVESDNESDAGHDYQSVANAQSYATFLSEFVTAASDRGFRPVILNIAVGNPSGDLMCSSESKGGAMQIFEQLVPAIVAAGQANGGWGYHAYTQEWDQDSANYQSFYSLRYRRYISCFAEIEDVPLFLTEAGFDKGGNQETDGWMSNGTPEDYLAWLDWFQNEIANDPQVVGATTFAFSSSDQWSSFKLNSISERYAALALAHSCQ
ncbi:hypothetical protein KYC5002_23875 [Archangium violaceum]|uniref:hypothetical protein n=1 Tax=Archangium violaceum TaxID=83451 RepID=UPI002B2C9385|nr:hypothetical protein KYC5002_23875 [Archangium gephyra]